MKMNWKSGKWTNLCIRALCITALAFMVSGVLTAPFSASTGAVFSAPEKTDFNLTDFYAQVANRRPVRALSDRILIIDIDRAGREEIAELISAVSLCDPQAIGVDISFEEHKENDSVLISAVTSGKAIILPVGLTESTARKGSFIITEHPFFFSELPGITYGAANLPGKSARSTIREFPVSFHLEDGKEILSFAAAVAQKADSAAYNALRARDTKIETIDFASREIPILTIPQFYESPESAVGKVVLIGAVNEASDTHVTPVTSSMDGVRIHAHALSTIFEGHYYSHVPEWGDTMAASVICFIMVLLNIAFTSKIKGFLLRVLQVAVVYTAIRLGYSLYVDHWVVFDFSRTLLMIAFGFFAIDIWNGLIWVWEKISPIKRKIESRQTNRSHMSDQTDQGDASAQGDSSDTSDTSVAADISDTSSPHDI